MAGYDPNSRVPGGGVPSQRSRLENPEIKAVLEANRAKLSLLQQADGSSDRFGMGAGGKNQPGAGRPAHGGDRHDAGHPLNDQFRSNPVYDTPGSSGAQTNSEDFSPHYIAPSRGPRSLLAPDPALPPLGDLFSAFPPLPKGLNLAPDTPRLPDWNTSRPHMSGRALFNSAAERAAGKKRSTASRSLHTLPVQVQEAMLVDDLMYAFGGVDGEWIRAKTVDSRQGTTIKFEIVTSKGQLEPALHEMVTRMLPLCEYVAVAARFVETRRTYEWGLVCQALGGAMRQVLQDWELMLAQLEHQLRSGKLTLQALWYYVQPPMAALRLVAGLAAEASAERLRGSSLLNLLHSKCAALMGDSSGQKLMLRLLRAASEPYFAALERWICEGVLDDPYNEVMVRENANAPKDPTSGDGAGFWTERWTLRPLSDPLSGAPIMSEAGIPAVDVPSFLASVSHQVLDAGRYLNLIRSCGRQAQRPLPLGIHLEYDEGGKYLLRVQEAHAAAASEAMTLLRKEIGLVSALGALKRYFLVAQGDLFLQFMDVAEADLGNMAGRVPLQILQRHLDAAIRSSSSVTDPAALRLKAAFDHRSVLNMLITITQTAHPQPNESPSKRQRLKAVTPAPMTPSERTTVGRQKLCRESFMLWWDAPWPLSIVASEAALAQYQMVFRHLFELKWVDRELNRVYGLYQATTTLANIQRRAARRESLVGAAAAAAIPMSSIPSLASHAALSSTLAKAYRTVQMMIHFFRQYLMYSSFEVLQPLWSAFEARVEGAATLDEIVEHHRIFIRKVMKGLLLSRKVVVLRALLGLKDLALQFVRLSSKFLEIDYEALDEQAEITVLGSSGRITDIERRLAKRKKLKQVLEKVLSNPEFVSGVNDLHSKFESKCGEFMTSLAEAHTQARSERSDTREELEGLVNLMGRLDFNGFLEGRGVHHVQGVHGMGGGGGPTSSASGSMSTGM